MYILRCSGVRRAPNQSCKLGSYSVDCLLLVSLLPAAERIVLKQFTRSEFSCTGTERRAYAACGSLWYICSNFLKECSHALEVFRGHVPGHLALQRHCGIV